MCGLEIQMLLSSVLVRKLEEQGKVGLIRGRQIRKKDKGKRK